MTNREKYAEQIIDIAVTGSLAVEKATGKPCDCGRFKCKDCIGCSGTKIKEWSEQEYVESTIDWTKVPVDTKILVRDSEDEPWRKRYFARYENNTIFAWCNGSTSYSASGYNDVTFWKCGKLAEEDV